MLRAMRSAASGMRAQQLYIDTVAHNLANVNTTGFKRTRVEFEDLLYQTLSPATGTEAGGEGQATPVQVGHGTRVRGTEKVFSQGDSEITENPLDLLIQGDGFFQVRRMDGTTAYTRNGSFKLDADGRLTTAQGNVLEPEVVLPLDTASIAVTGDGRVFVEQAGAVGSMEVGQILLARFPNPGGLAAKGGNLLVESAATGDPQVGTPGEVGLGGLIQGAVERSNVEVVEEMISLIVAQRAFEMSSKAVRTAEEMAQIAANLRP